MRVLVTGANGLVGSRLCALLVEQGHAVTGIGRGARRVGGTFPYQSCELTDSAAVTASVSAAKPEVILHTASMTEVDGCEKNRPEAFAANVLAPTYLAQAARTVDAHMVHVSTDYVFDGDRGGYSETDLANPRGVYAVTKYMGEQAVQLFAPSWAIARTAVVYGWPAAGRPNFGAWLVGALRGGQEVRLFEDQYVSPSLALNVAAMVAELGERRLTGIWHTAGASVTNRVEFAQALAEVFGFGRGLLIPTRMADLKLPSPRPLNSSLKVDKALRELKAKPLPLHEALQAFHAEFRAG